MSRPPRWIDASTTQILACLRRRGRRLGSRPRLYAVCALDPRARTLHVLVVGRVADPRLLCIGKDSPLQLQDSPGVGSHVDAWWWLPVDRAIDPDYALKERLMYSGLPIRAYEVWTVESLEPLTLGGLAGIVQLSPEAAEEDRYPNTDGHAPVAIVP